MDLKIVLIYCICSDFLKSMECFNHSFSKMSDDEVVAFAIISAMFFYGNHENTRIFLQEYRYIPNILSKSQINRRLHSFDESFWKRLLHQLSLSLLHYEKTNEYAVDSFPLNPSCVKNSCYKSFWGELELRRPLSKRPTWQSSFLLCFKNHFA